MTDLPEREIVVGPDVIRETVDGVVVKTWPHPEIQQICDAWMSRLSRVVVTRIRIQKEERL